MGLEELSTVVPYIFPGGGDVPPIFQWGGRPPYAASTNTLGFFNRKHKIIFKGTVKTFLAVSLVKLCS